MPPMPLWRCLQDRLQGGATGRTAAEAAQLIAKYAIVLTAVARASPRHCSTSSSSTGTEHYSNQGFESSSSSNTDSFVSVFSKAA
jgi:hypothetical protein